MGAAAGPPVSVSSVPSGVPWAGGVEVVGAAALLAAIAVTTFTGVTPIGDSSRLSTAGEKVRQEEGPPQPLQAL